MVKAKSVWQSPKLPVENAMLNRVHYHAKRDKRLSRNDNRVYAWAIGYNKVDNGPAF